MTISTLVEQYEAKEGQVWGHQIRVISYKLSSKFVCLIENLDVGAAICRVSGPTKMDAIRDGLSQAMFLMTATVPRAPDASYAVVTEAQPAEEHIDRILMDVDGLPVAYTVEEFNAMTTTQRMHHILNGSVSFFTASGDPITPEHAIEILRRGAE